MFDDFSIHSYHVCRGPCEQMFILSKQIIQRLPSMIWETATDTDWLVGVFLVDHLLFHRGLSPHFFGLSRNFRWLHDREILQFLW